MRCTAESSILLNGTSAHVQPHMTITNDMGRFDVDTERESAIRRRTGALTSSVVAKPLVTSRERCSASCAFMPSARFGEMIPRTRPSTCFMSDHTSDVPVEQFTVMEDVQQSNSVHPVMH